MSFFDYRISVFFSLLLFLFLLFIYLPDSSSTYVDLEVEQYSIDEKVSSDWSKLCLFGMAEIPSTETRKYSKFPCDVEFDVSSGSVVMVYYYENKQCESLRFPGYFLSETDTETRCFDPGDTELLKFHYENKIIELRLK